MPFYSAPLFGPSQGERLRNWFVGSSSEPERKNAYLTIGLVIGVALLILGAIVLSYGFAALPLAACLITAGGGLSLILGKKLYKALPEKQQTTIHFNWPTAKPSGKLEISDNITDTEISCFQTSKEAAFYADELKQNECVYSKEGHYYTNDGKFEPNMPKDKTLISASDLMERVVFYDLTS